MGLEIESCRSAEYTPTFPKVAHELIKPAVVFITIFTRHTCRILKWSIQEVPIHIHTIWVYSWISHIYFI